MMTLPRHALAAALAAVCVFPVLAGGPVPVLRDDLPKAIARLHTCVPPGAMTQWRPAPERAGNAGVVFSVSCPLDGPGVVPVKNGRPWPQLAIYLARGKSGIGARRLTFPYLNPDGEMTEVNVLPVVPAIGWTTKAHNSARDGAARFDRNRIRLPNNAFHILENFKPDDRPEIANVMAIWQVENQQTSLIYWAETTQTLRGREPGLILPQYKTVLDRRPEN